MPYDREISQIFNTIKKAGNGASCTVERRSGIDEITGEGGSIESFTAYFCVESYNNLENPVHSNLKEDIKILLTPLLENGTIIPNFVDICRDKSAIVTLPSGESRGVSYARVTYPDTVNPLLARMTIGG